MGSSIIYNPAHCLKSVSQALLSVPLPSEVKWVVTRDTTFSVVATYLWNTLHYEAHLVPALFSFRQQAKTHLLMQVFN